MSIRKVIDAKHSCGRQLDKQPDPTISTRHAMGAWKRRINRGGKVPCQACKDTDR